MPTPHLSESLSKPAKRPAAERPARIRKMISFKIGSHDATVVKIGGTPADRCKSEAPFLTLKARSSAISMVHL